MTEHESLIWKWDSKCRTHTFLPHHKVLSSYGLQLQFSSLDFLGIAHRENKNCRILPFSNLPLEQFITQLSFPSIFFCLNFSVKATERLPNSTLGLTTHQCVLVPRSVNKSLVGFHQKSHFYYRFIFHTKASRRLQQHPCTHIHQCLCLYIHYTPSKPGLATLKTAVTLFITKSRPRDCQMIVAARRPAINHSIGPTN